MSHDSEHDKKCYEYYRTKCFKLQEQLNTEQEKANEAVREYCLLIQKSDKVRSSCSLYSSLLSFHKS